MALALDDDYQRVLGALDALSKGTGGLSDAQKDLGQRLKEAIANLGDYAAATDEASEETQDFAKWAGLANKRLREMVATQKQLQKWREKLDLVGETEEGGVVRELKERLKLLGDIEEKMGVAAKPEFWREQLLTEWDPEKAEDLRVQLEKAVDHEEWAAGRRAAIWSDYHEQLSLMREEQRSADFEAAMETSEAWSDAFGSMSNLAGAFRELIIAGYGEETQAAKAAARKMFLVQQSLAFAQAMISMSVAIAKANELGYPQNIPAMITAGATGAAQAAAIMATTIKGVADAGLPPGALRAAGLNSHSLIAMRNDEMVLDPVGTRYITEMLAIQRTQMASGGGEQVIRTTVELDGQVLGAAVDRRLIRQQERGLPYGNRVRQGYMAI